MVSFNLLNIGKSSFSSFKGDSSYSELVITESTTSVADDNGASNLTSTLITNQEQLALPDHHQPHSTLLPHEQPAQLPLMVAAETTKAAAASPQRQESSGPPFNLRESSFIDVGMVDVELANNQPKQTASSTSSAAPVATAVPQAVVVGEKVRKSYKISQPPSKDDPVRVRLRRFMYKSKSRMFLTMICTIVSILLLAIIIDVVIVFGTSQCLFKRCLGKNEVCVNKIFKHECECSLGYVSESVGLLKRRKECVLPCSLSTSTCGRGARCKNQVNDHICLCNNGLYGDPYKECTKKCIPECNVNQTCVSDQERAECVDNDSQIDEENIFCQQNCNLNAECLSVNQTYSKCVCKPNYAGDGLSYCDECDLTNVAINENNNTTTTPATMTTNIWPSIALIEMFYETSYEIIVANKNNNSNESISVKNKTASIRRLCNGVLIDRQDILVAAHCLTNRPSNVSSSSSFLHYDYEVEQYVEINITLNGRFPTWQSLYTIYLGFNDLSQVLDLQSISTNDSNLTVVKPTRIIVHESYDPRLFFNDVAIMRVKKVELSNKIQLACLPEQNSDVYPYTDQLAWTAGWIPTSGSHKEASFNNGQLIILDQSFCTKYPNENESYQLCAGSNQLDGQQQNQFFCFGANSSGPLFVETEIAATATDSSNKTIRRRVLVGFSMAPTAASAVCSNPALFTRISFYLNWIDANRI